MSVWQKSTRKLPLNFDIYGAGEGTTTLARSEEVTVGQRHQIYVKIAELAFDKKNPNYRPSKVIGVHHQWLYGFGAAKQLMNLLTFHTNQQKYGPFSSESVMSDPSDALRSIYSVDIESGYYHPVHALGDDICENPRMGDNNDGITIVDFSDKKEAKYAFMSIDGLECIVRSRVKKYKDLVPMSATEWLNLYYPGFENPVLSENSEKIGTLLDVDDNRAEYEAIKKQIRELAEKFSNYKVLTEDEVKTIFPKLYL